MIPYQALNLKEGVLLRVVEEPPYPGQTHAWTQAISYNMSGNSHFIPFGEYVLYLRPRRPTMRNRIVGRRRRPTMRLHKKSAQWVIVLHNESVVVIDPKYLELIE